MYHFRHRTIVTSACLLLGLAVFGGCSPKENKGVASGADGVGSSSDGGPESSATAGEVLAITDLNSVDWESLIGQNVKIEGDLVVVDTYDLARRGQVKVARNRLYIPTNQIDPNDAQPNGNTFEGGSNVANVTKAQQANNSGTLILDDGSDAQNIFPPKLFPELGKSEPTVRVGSVIQGVSGKLIKNRDKILLVPDGQIQWKPAARPERPAVGQAKVTVASFNVLNYFTTLDDGNNNARGADSPTELKRQQDKLVEALAGLKADVIGLMELENNLESEQRLVSALNEKLGQDVFVGCGLPADFRSAPGGKDAIRVGIIYRKDRVTPAGDVALIRDPAFYEARAPIVQEFKPLASSTSFTVVVNHFKSKGGADEADEANQNKGDGQGAYNALRRSQAMAICKFIQSMKEPDPRVLVIGDLNAYAEEDPIDAMRAQGLVDLQQKNPAAESHYSYIYYGQSGSLDHAMATSSLAKDVTGVATWHINADEPRFLDYNQEYNPKELYKADPFRSSDHDPVLIGIGH